MGRMNHDTNKGLIKEYSEAGIEFGACVARIGFGICADFEEKFKEWMEMEEKYAEAGYRTVSLDDFMRAAGEKIKIDTLLQQELEEGEDPTFHAALYQKYVYGREDKFVSIQKTETGIVMADYRIPSTEKMAELEKKKLGELLEE